ncbi:MAG: hypothetical protein NVS3B20_15380 [Polyangiales bacterium]
MSPTHIRAAAPRVTTCVRSRRARARGFTLLELLAATVASLLVVIAALVLSRGATRLFAGETRVGASQFNLRLGIDRMRSDIERAAFMSSPNGHSDPDVCPDPTTGTPIMYMQGVSYVQNANTPETAPVQALTTSNNLSYDLLRLPGNYATTDSYLVSTIDINSAGVYNIYLQRQTGAMARLLAAGESGSPANLLAAAFPNGNILRVTNLVGSSQFLIISTSAIGSDGVPIISARQAPPIRTTAGAVARCGIPGGGAACMGCTVNSVQTVDYMLGSLKTNTAFGWAYPEAGVAADTEKYDLVRRARDQDGNSDYSLVAEYVVDLAFAFSVDTDTTGTAPNIVSFPFGDANNTAYGADVTVTNTARPQRIRSVRYRVGTRSKDADRETPGADAGPGLLRYYIGPTQYSRVRTIYGEISLINQQGVSW